MDSDGIKKVEILAVDGLEQMSDEEETSDVLIYPGPYEEGAVWASASRAVKEHGKRKERFAKSRSQTRPPPSHYSEGKSITPAERRARLTISVLVFALLSFGLFLGLLFVLNR